MVDSFIRDQLVQRLDGLPRNLQQRVLDYAQSLAETAPKGVPGHTLLRFAGCLEPEEGEAMMRAIEEGCENVDPNGW